MKTRAKKPSAPKAAPASTESKHVLPPPSTNPPHLFILPRNAGPDARILSLPHPATSRPARFFIDPEKGVYEFTRVSAPKKTCRSVLLAAEEEDDGEGYVLQTAEVFIATALDAVFALLPAFCTGEEWGTFYDRLFSSSDEDEEGEDGGRYAHLSSVFQSSPSGRALEKNLETRMRSICDTISLADEVSYKLSPPKLAHLLYAKAERMVSRGLPPSLSEHFVRLPLQAPELSVTREDSTLSIMVDEPPTTTNPPAEPEELKHLLRLRTALAYLCSSYVPPTLVPKLQEHFIAMVDFAPLDDRLAEIAKLKHDALALRSLGDNISRKRRGEMDDEDSVQRAETKKRKKEEEDMKKKNTSQGVKRLAKVDTKGMKKMSSFFTKKS
ncbi:hypothetical protein LTR27_008146 [Elasticomyces elasticus]|nr:hypothetical protein LTR27_008146 [Elasticomyces elasticus]